MNDSAIAQECRTRAKLASESLEKLFWNPRLGYYNYGVKKSGEEVTYLNPAIGYSAWFGSLPQQRSQAVLERLATAQFLSDWGERSMSLEDHALRRELRTRLAQHGRSLRSLPCSPSIAITMQCKASSRGCR